jgi:hypothetical protein
MKTLLDDRITRKKEIVKSLDLVTIGLNLTGIVLMSTAVAQPGNTANGIRLLLSCAFIGVSVISENFRAKDLDALMKALEFKRTVKSNVIQKDLQLKQTALDLQEEAAIWEKIPESKWDDLRQRVGINPPINPDSNNYIPPVVDQSLDLPLPMNSVTTVVEKPCDDDYDPEDELNYPKDGIIFASNVDEWFELYEDVEGIEDLKSQWFENPGKAIQIENGQAQIIH